MTTLLTWFIELVNIFQISLWSQSLVVIVSTLLKFSKNKTTLRFPRSDDIYFGFKSRNYKMHRPLSWFIVYNSHLSTLTERQIKMKDADVSFFTAQTQECIPWN